MRYLLAAAFVAAPAPAPEKELAMPPCYFRRLPGSEPLHPQPPGFFRHGPVPRNDTEIKAHGREFA